MDGQSTQRSPAGKEDIVAMVSDIISVENITNYSTASDYSAVSSSFFEKESKPSKKDELYKMAADDATAREEGAAASACGSSSLARR